MSQRRSTAVTLTAINAMSPGDIIHDTTLTGFGARRQLGTVSYFLKTRVDGKQRWFTIGRHGQPWTPDTARKHALQILADPSIAEKTTAPTSQAFPDVAALFLTKHGPKLKARTLVEYKRLSEQYLVPAFAKLSIRDITRAHVSTAHNGWAKTPRTANFALTVLSKLMTWAEDEGFRDDNTNPCRRVQRFAENKRERYLQPAELTRLGAALEKAEAEHQVGSFAIAAIRLLIFTGARYSEILTLQWAHVDLDRQMCFLPDSKTGQKPLPLNAAAIGVLTSLPRFANNPYVIAGNRRGTHLVNLHHPWNVVCELAGLDTVRLHDLRHTYASIAVASGGSLPVLGRQLGHSEARTTQRYAHLADDPVRKLNETTGEALAQALKAKPKAT